MSWRRWAGGGKRDAAERAILDDLHALKIRTWQLSGKGNPDVLARYAGRWIVFEVKTGRAQPNANQQAIPWPIVRTTEEAIAAINAAL